MDVLAKQPPKLKKRLLSSKQKQLHNFAFGAHGEARAKVFFLKHGYSLLAENCRFFLHELDLVFFDPQKQEVVFVEVKSRSTSGFGEPALAVTPRKIRSMERVARVFLREKRLGQYDFRFDVVVLIGEQLNHYPNVTWEMVK